MPSLLTNNQSKAPNRFTSETSIIQTALRLSLPTAHQLVLSANVQLEANTKGICAQSDTTECEFDYRFIEQLPAQNEIRVYSILIFPLLPGCNRRSHYEELQGVNKLTSITEKFFRL